MHPDTVRSIPLFASLSRRRRNDLARLADEVDVPAGYRLTSQGGYAREFFVVIAGSAEVSRDGAPVGTVAAGDFFGEVGLLSPRWERTATVVATTPMRLLVFARKEFREFLDTLPAIAAPIVRAAAERA
ncbi:MAG TPA: cyclic nucleotide-binding domain-containing protein [Solirubrobacteraceae bacterium]|nr:cyclic nucleotide-binding domain-containing protein [Solirubrobacteraceae bacterium]